MFIKFENIKEFNRFIKEHNVIDLTSEYNKKSYYSNLAKELMRQYNNNVVVKFYMNNGKIYVEYCALRFVPDLENCTITDTVTMKVYEFDINDDYGDFILDIEKYLIKEIQNDLTGVDKKMCDTKSDDYIDLECAAEKLAKILLKD